MEGLAPKLRVPPVGLDRDGHPANRILGRLCSRLNFGCSVLMIVVHEVPAFQLFLSLGLPVRGSSSDFSMIIVIALSDRIAREENPDEQEHQRHADEADHDDQRVGLPLHCGEGGQHHGIERDGR